MNEMREFLGDKYSPKSDHWFRQQMDWEHDSARQHYLAFVREVMTGHENRNVLDYDCGTGWAGLELIKWGFVPSFAGNGKCTDFLKWRLKQRDLACKVYSLDRAPHVPLVVSFDSLLKYKDAWKAIERLVTTGEVVIFDLNKRWPVISGSTYSVDVGSLVEQVKEVFTILSYKIYNHYAHLFAIQGIEQQEEQNNGE